MDFITKFPLTLVSHSLSESVLIESLTQSCWIMTLIKYVLYVIDNVTSYIKSCFIFNYWITSFPKGGTTGAEALWIVLTPDNLSHFFNFWFLISLFGQRLHLHTTGLLICFHFCSLFFDTVIYITRLFESDMSYLIQKITQKKILKKSTEYLSFVSSWPKTLMTFFGFSSLIWKLKHY